MAGRIDITAAITAHAEGVMAGASLNSLVDAVRAARAAGLACEIVIGLDNPSPPTRALLAACEEPGVRLIEYDFGDQGRARNAAVDASRGEYIAFLDADDLWSANWLTEAYALCATDPGRVIAHPEFNWFFENNANLYMKIGMDEEGFDPAFLRVANYWDALSMAPRHAHVDHPFYTRDVRNGWAFEDWGWNQVTVDAGFRHLVCKGTIHFKRRRQQSQTIEASSRKTLARRTAMSSYRWRAPAAAAPGDENGSRD